MFFSTSDLAYLRISKVVWQILCQLLSQTLFTNSLRTDEHQHWIRRLQDWQRSNHRENTTQQTEPQITNTLITTDNVSK